MQVGIIGAGFMGRTHLTAWRELGFPVTVFSHRSDSLPDDVPLAADLASLLDAVDVVDICTPTDTHAELVMVAAAAGCHVVCEKPLARTVEEAERMLSVCAQHNVSLWPAHVVRYFPEYAAIQRAVADGQVGRPAVVRLTRTTDWPAWTDWLFELDRSGGVLVDLMIHDFDIARWLAGDVVRVFAAGQRDADARVMRGYAVLTHASGAISHVEGAWGPPGSGWHTRVEVSGDGGMLAADSTDPVPFHVDPPRPLPALPDQPYVDELAEFAAAITDGAVPRVSAADGVAALRIALAAEESIRTGRAVTLRAAEPAGTGPAGTGPAGTGPAANGPVEAGA